MFCEQCGELHNQGSKIFSSIFWRSLLIIANARNTISDDVIFIYECLLIVFTRIETKKN